MGLPPGRINLKNRRMTTFGSEDLLLRVYIDVTQMIEKQLSSDVNRLDPLGSRQYLSASDDRRWRLSCFLQYVGAINPVNTKHLYSICTMLDQRLRRWSDVVQMLYKCFVFAGNTT